MPYHGSMILSEQRLNRPVETVLAMPEQQDDVDSWMYGCEPTSRLSRKCRTSDDGRRRWMLTDFESDRLTVLDSGFGFDFDFDLG